MEIIIQDFEALEDYIRGFAAGHINMLGIIGSAGIQKSTVVRQIMGDTARYIEGIATPFELHRELWRWLNKPFVIDDVDHLCSNRTMVSQLKSLCDTRTVKRVCWHTAATLLDEEGIPREFDTRTRVIIIANMWKTIDKNIGALQDRGHIIRFQPSVQAVHARVVNWFKDAEIYDFIGEHLRSIPEPSMRHYVESLELKNAGIDWRGPLLSTWGVDPRTALVIQLQCDETLPSQEAKATAFTAKTGLCRRTYFYTLDRVRRDQEKHCTLALPKKNPVQKCNPLAVASVASDHVPMEAPVGIS